MSKLETLGNDVEEALEHLNVPSYVLDEHGIIRWVNPAAMQVVGDVRGKLFTSVVAPEETSRAKDEFAKKVQRKHAALQDIRMRRSSSSTAAANERWSRCTPSV